MIYAVSLLMDRYQAVLFKDAVLDGIKLPVLAKYLTLQPVSSRENNRLKRCMGFPVMIRAIRAIVFLTSSDRKGWGGTV